MKKAILERAREVFDVEIEGLVAVRDNLGESFEQLVHRCMDVINAGGKLVFTGVGKSGYIGKKIAATLSSVGSPSVFMHPVEKPRSCWSCSLLRSGSGWSWFPSPPPQVPRSGK